jgi:hypothetical protein
VLHIINHRAVKFSQSHWALVIFYLCWLTEYIHIFQYLAWQPRHCNRSCDYKNGDGFDDIGHQQLFHCRRPGLVAAALRCCWDSISQDVNSKIITTTCDVNKWATPIDWNISVYKAMRNCYTASLVMNDLSHVSLIEYCFLTHQTHYWTWN